LGQTNDVNGPNAAFIAGERVDKIGNSAQRSRALSPLVNLFLRYSPFLDVQKLQCMTLNHSKSSAEAPSEKYVYVATRNWTK